VPRRRRLPGEQQPPWIRRLLFHRLILIPAAGAGVRVCFPAYVRFPAQFGRITTPVGQGPGLSV
jgi:hypothetical protein